MEACTGSFGMPPIGSHSDIVDWLAEVVMLAGRAVVCASTFTSRQKSSAVTPDISPVALRTCWLVSEGLAVGVRW